MAEDRRRGLGDGTRAKRVLPPVPLPLLLGLLLLDGCSGRIHQLVLTGEKRADIQLNSFGFFTNGSLEVELSLLRLNLESQKKTQKGQWQMVGFSLSRARTGSIRSYSAPEPHTCALKHNGSNLMATFLIDFKEKQVHVCQFGEQKKLQISPGLLQGGVSLPSTDNETSAAKQDGASPPLSSGSQESSQKEKGLVLSLGYNNDSYSFSFHVVIGSPAEEGIYNLNFHNCYNAVPGHEKPFDITIMIQEKNPQGFLSATEIPLYKLYLIMSACFLGAGALWVSVLCKHKYSVFKIHWLMAALAFTKSASLLFHSINYYFINSQGRPIEGLAVTDYITHLLKGALLFITIALIGSGWAFVKYVLSDKEKKLFGVVIPLQVLANVAYIIIESTEEGTSDYALWKEILFLVDLICCGAILFPVVWSIRHLQEASGTDGKVAVNLAKLKLFRHYYVMTVCYIYFSRIVAVLLRVSVPFQWQWLNELLVEVSTLVFFILTGYKFRPASNNPYLQLPQEDDEEDVQMDQVMTESGLREGLSKVNKTATSREAL